MPAAAPHPLARLNHAAEALWEPLGRIWQEHLQATGQAHGDGGVGIDVLAEVDSTNTALMQRARSGDTSPTLMVALTQTAGRGRMGKSWQAVAGGSLTFSVSLPMSPASWSGLSLAVGVGVVEGLLAAHAAAEQTGHPAPPLKLKWPNDVWVNHTKLGGILVETAHIGDKRQVVVGVGINVLPVPSVLPTAPSLPPSPASPALPPVPPAAWSDWVPGAHAADVLRGMAPTLMHSLLQFEREGFAAFQARFAALDALAGQPVVLSDGSHGMARGVNATGELLIEGPNGVRALHSTEVSIRPRSVVMERP